jgi:hypothetical protein
MASIPTPLGSVAIHRQNVYQMSGVGSRRWRSGRARAGIDMESHGSGALLRGSPPQELMTGRGIGVKYPGATGMDDFQAELELVGGREALASARQNDQALAVG